MTGSVIFNLVYADTVASFPGAIFLVAAGFHVAVLFFYWYEMEAISVAFLLLLRKKILETSSQ